MKKFDLGINSEAEGAPSPVVIGQTYMLLDELPKKYIKAILPGSIYQTDYGTIIIEWFGDLVEPSYSDYALLEIGVDGYTIATSIMGGDVYGDNGDVYGRIMAVLDELYGDR